MFGLFNKKKTPKNALDEFIFAIYGNPPPPKRANVGRALSMANELLMGRIDEKECVFHANWTPIPRQTGHPFHANLDSRSVATRG